MSNLLQDNNLFLGAMRLFDAIWFFFGFVCSSGPTWLTRKKLINWCLGWSRSTDIGKLAHHWKTFRWRSTAQFAFANYMSPNPSSYFLEIYSTSISFLLTEDCEGKKIGAYDLSPFLGFIRRIGHFDFERNGGLDRRRLSSDLVMWCFGCDVMWCWRTVLVCNRLFLPECLECYPMSPLLPSNAVSKWPTWTAGLAKGSCLISSGKTAV